MIGVWAYLDNNIGDDLMIKLLVEYFNTEEFYIYTNSSTVENTFSVYNNITIRKQKDFESDQKDMKLFVSIGGSIFNSLNSITGKISRIMNIKMIKKLKRLGVQVATIGCNLGPFKDNFAKKIALYELSLNDLVTVRDKESFSIIDKSKLSVNYVLADDIVYQLPSDIKRTIRYGLGITAYRSKSVNEINFQNYQALAEIANNYIERTQEMVAIFAYDSESENDLAAAHHIFHLIDNKDKVKIIPYLGNIEMFLNEFSSCAKVIAIRFHGAILSNVYEIPCIPIIYSNKMDNLLKDNKYRDYKITIENLTIEELDIKKITEDLIIGSNLFVRDTDNNAYLHFEELSKLIESINN